MSTIGPSPFLCGFALALYQAHRAGRDDRSVDKAMKAAQITVAALRAAGVNERDVIEIERCVRPSPVTDDPSKPPWGDGNPRPYEPPWCTCHRDSPCDGDGGRPNCEYSVADHERYNDACAAWDAVHPDGEINAPLPEDHPVILAMKNAPWGGPLSEAEQKIEDEMTARHAADLAAGVRMVPHAEVMASLALRAATEHCGCPYHAARKAERDNAMIAWTSRPAWCVCSNGPCPGDGSRGGCKYDKAALEAWEAERSKILVPGWNDRPYMGLM